jgi:hypothetical protein
MKLTLNVYDIVYVTSLRGAHLSYNSYGIIIRLGKNKDDGSKRIIIKILASKNHPHNNTRFLGGYGLHLWTGADSNIVNITPLNINKNYKKTYVDLFFNIDYNVFLKNTHIMSEEVSEDREYSNTMEIDI